MNEDFDIKGDLNFGDVGFDIGDIDSSLFEVDFDGGEPNRNAICQANA